MNASCKHIIEEFEQNLAKRKELKATQQTQQTQQTQPATKIVQGRASLPAQKAPTKADTINKPGPSTAAQTV